MQSLVADLERSLGAGGLVSGETAAEQAFSPWTRLGKPMAIARPRSTDEVAQVLRTAGKAGVPVVPWGGRTGLVDGAHAEGAIALSLERMAAIEEIDPIGSTMTVQAGCVLEKACEAADAAGLFLPLDLGARGSATVGGVVSTNAGGNRVIRYGMTRDMILGLEVVLADGTVIPAMNRLIKNNTGYDLKQLFIGSEGTLGVVTRAVFRLRAKPASQSTAFLAVDGFAALPKLLRRVDSELGGALSAFEVMWPAFYELVTTEPAAGRSILPPGHDFYVLVESLGADPQADGERFEEVLAGVLEDGLAADAVVAKSQGERDRMWALRDDVRQTARNGPTVVFDISLPIPQMEAYLDEVRQALTGRWPRAELTVFGHLGDGNLHLIAGVGDSKARHEIEDIVYGPLKARGGSVSAEHGIGLQKLAYLPASRSAAELALMRTLKSTLDPRGILNPGKVVG
ncbi:MAG TPA: FAD-binding oxidoreductase [Phenylobacterium sp.]|uniref:FAD-binding oxidoreductase n=1 Tax=Phenylobacterium sp. TaxID=1871053 RepID=UPI002C5C0930|nr:FAD-binding oxidoreductase [Phenylobacterium sp.]HSV04212.1 FAD-binding oxidoreductase [Phenylobacterium sp.]